jgi:hypothetical protein
MGSELLLLLSGTTLKLYEVDKRNVYRLLPKVTERHIKPVGQNTMKVSLAAQVMSSTLQDHSPVLQQEELRSLISAMRIVKHCQYETSV